jgi:hypothetical protein
VLEVAGTVRACNYAAGEAARRKTVCARVLDSESQDAQDTGATAARGEIAGGRRRLGGGLGCEDAEENLGERKRLLCADKNPDGCRIDARRASAGQRAVGSAQGMGRGLRRSDERWSAQSHRDESVMP